MKRFLRAAARIRFHFRLAALAIDAKAMRAG
jgi:hypothetical protein